MTTLSFYRRVALLPVVIPLIALVPASLIVIGPGSGPGLRFALDIFMFVVVAGLCSVVPYALFLALVVWWIRPSTPRQLRRLSWLAPLYIALPFALLAAALPLAQSGWLAKARAFAYFDILALGVGYTYVMLIEAALFLGRRMECIASADPTEARRA